MFENFQKALDTIVDKYDTVLIDNARVRTGALKRSISSQILYTGDDTTVLTRMMEYGENARVWHNLKTPVETFATVFTADEIGKLTVALGKDVLKDLKMELDKLKK